MSDNKLTSKLFNRLSKLNKLVNVSIRDSDELVNKLIDSLNNLIKNDLTVRSTNLSNELLETLKILEDCTDCKDKLEKHYCYGFRKTANKIMNFPINLEKEQHKKEDIIYKLRVKLIKIDKELNRKVLCESCKRKKLEKLIKKYGNEQV